MNESSVYCIHGPCVSLSLFCFMPRAATNELWQPTAKKESKVVLLRFEMSQAKEVHEMQGPRSALPTYVTAWPNHDDVAAINNDVIQYSCCTALRAVQQVKDIPSFPSRLAMFTAYGLFWKLSMKGLKYEFAIKVSTAVWKQHLAPTLFTLLIPQDSARKYE